MSVLFEPGIHKYTSMDPNENITWVSATKLVGFFKSPFDGKKISEKSSKDKSSKWYGLTPSEIRDLWKIESKRSTDDGSWYHDSEEARLLSNPIFVLPNGDSVPVISPMYNNHGHKIAPSQVLYTGLYPEHFMFLKSKGVCGQSDRVDVARGKVNILDYKTNKKLDLRSYVGWDGKSKMMTGLLKHLEDCNMTHYTLQLSLYMYIMIRHNRRLTPGNLELSHVLFEIEGKDKYDFPILRRTPEGHPIVLDTVKYTVPYLEEEVVMMLNHLDKNPQLRFKGYD